VLLVLVVFVPLGLTSKRGQSCGAAGGGLAVTGENLFAGLRCSQMFSQLIPLGGQKHLLERAGFGEMMLRFVAVTEFRRDHARVKKEARVLSALR
jgi:hypothetical protein